MSNGLQLIKQQEPVYDHFPSRLGLPLVRVLYVEDDDLDARIFASLLDEAQPGFYDVTHVDNLIDCSSMLQSEQFDLVLLDINIPGSPGMHSIRAIQQLDMTIPIVCISGCSDESTAFQMVEAGAQDFINKSDMNPEQIARIVRFSMYRKSAEENLRTAAQRDLLTGLPNRGLLEDRLEHAVSIALRKQTSVALMFLDLDKFKSVNDTYGHLVGDALLSAVGERLTECIRESDTVARIGGDEFMVLLEEVTSDDDAKIVAEKIISAINKPFLIGARKVTTSTSIGIDVYPGDACNTETLMKNADKAMYEAKSSGRNNYQLYSEHCNDASSPMQGELFR